jgi:hypothetical protein
MPVKILDIYKTNRLSDLALHAAKLAGKDEKRDDVDLVQDAHNRASDHLRNVFADMNRSFAERPETRGIVML